MTFSVIAESNLQEGWLCYTLYDLANLGVRPLTCIYKDAHNE